ncbi:MAG: PEGA domain-containing protein [Phycisphaerales bacterium]
MGSRTTALAVLFVAGALLPSCVRRTIDITSEPPGALVLLNDREVGRTPVLVEFTYYGEYDVRLLLDGYEPLETGANAKPPLWDNVPLDFFAEMVPGDPDVRIAWHFVLEPAKSEGLLERATTMKDAATAAPAPSAP